MNEQEIVLTYSQPTTEQHKLQGPTGGKENPIEQHGPQGQHAQALTNMAQHSTTVPKHGKLQHHTCKLLTLFERCVGS